MKWYLFLLEKLINMICERARRDKYTQIKEWKVVMGTYTGTSMTKVRID